MKTKLVAVLAAAAALVAGAVLVPDALQKSLTEAGIDCAAWDAEVSNWSPETFYLRVADGTKPPTYVGDNLLGTCSAGACEARPTECKVALAWKYAAGPSVKGWSLWEISAPTYVGAGLKAWAKDDTTHVEWLGGRGQVVAELAKATNATDAAALMARDTKCWVLSDGRTCSLGRVYGPGQGGNIACPNELIKAAMPCVVDRGAGAELVEAAKTFDDTTLKSAIKAEVKP